MKQFISLFIALSIFAIGCIHSLAGFFVENNGDNSHAMMVQSDTNCCNKVMEDCSTSSHECCISPYQKDISYYNILPFDHSSKKIKVKILDYSFLAILQESFDVNFTQRLNSPPSLLHLIVGNSDYSTVLTGIIKINC